MGIQVPALQGDVGSTIRDRLEQIKLRLGGRLKLGWRARFTRYGLCRDITIPIKNPEAKIPITVRPLQEQDFAALFSAAGSDDAGERLQVAWRRAFVEKGASRGYVAIDQRNGTPCYAQWLFGAEDNDFVGKLGGFPVLAPHQALLENAYTPPAYRGLGIMSAAMALIAERAADIGAREVITFVDLDNIASLKGCERSGFQPQQLHHRTRLGFGLIARDRFVALPADDPRRTLKF